MMKQKLRTTIEKIDGDLLTPILIFQRLAGKQKFLLESSAKYESAGRYSFIGVNPRKTYKGAGTTLTEISHLTNQTYSYEGDLVALLKQVMPRISNQTDLPFTGGAIGYIRFNREQASIPAVHFQVYETLIVFDHLTQAITIIHTNIDAEQKEADITSIIEQIKTPSQQETSDFTVSPFNEQLTKDELDVRQKTFQQQIDNGQLQGVTFARKQRATLGGSPFNYYRQLRIEQPSPYMYYIEFDDHTVLGTGANSIIAVANGQVRTTTSGIERVAVKGSVEQTNEVFEAALHPTYHAIDALTQLLPTDQVSGAPKEAALEAIRAIEEDERNLFGGAIGYIGFNGQIDFTAANDAILATANEQQDSFHLTREIGTTLGKIEVTLVGANEGGN